MNWNRSINEFKNGEGLIPLSPVELDKIETFSQMLPRRLTGLLPADRDNIEWGMGIIWMRPKGLGARTFGHGAASSAILRIDPDNDLVIVMTRNAAGKNYKEYLQRFIATIAENLPDADHSPVSPSAE